VEVAAYYKKTEPTIRAWANEFADHLSPTANPGKGKGRSFTLDDLMVFSLVSEMKDRNHTFEDIHAALKSGQRGDPPSLSENDLRVLKATEGEKRAAFEIQALQQHMVDLQQRLNKAEQQAAEAAALKEELASSQTRINMLTETKDDLQQRLDKAQQQIGELNRQLGREYAQGFKEGLREQGRGEGAE
jgi:DNA-binding transcriptional MerR regulator